jgi:hypothetical protein
MHGKERFAEVGRCFQIAQDVSEEMGGVGEGGVAFLIVCGWPLLMFWTGVVGRRCWRLVVEDDYFVDVEDGEGAGDGAAEIGLLVVGFGVGDYTAWEGDGKSGCSGWPRVEDSGGFGCWWFIVVEMAIGAIGAGFGARVGIVMSASMLSFLKIQWIEW